MNIGRTPDKGGSDAAFILSLAGVAVLGFGGSLQYPLAFLRAGAFGAALAFLWRRRGESVRVGPYPLLVGGFVLFSFGHSLSSSYFWVSFQHALNLALAAVLMAWAYLLFRKNPVMMWNATLATTAVLAITEIGIALFQRFSLGKLRPQGTFDNANYLAEFLVATSVLFLSRVLWETGSRRLRTAAGAGVLVLLAAAFYLTGSRGVLVASVPAFGVLLVLRFGLRRGGMLLAGVGVPALALLGLRAGFRFFGLDVHNYSRWIIWKSALRTFLEHPFGVGLGGFKYHWSATESPVPEAFSRFGKFATTAHSEYLEVLSGLGIVGFLLFLAVLAAPLVLAILRRAEVPPERRTEAAGAAGVLVLSGAHALFNANFHVFGIFVLDAVMLGALLASLPISRSPTVAVPDWGRFAGMACFSVLLIATFSAALGSWSFDRGERLIRDGDLPGAERSFQAAAYVDPFRAIYPDALSAIRYRRYSSERRVADSVRADVLLAESIRWEGRAVTLNPRETKYLQRLSSLFAERFRFRGRSADFDAAMALASRSLEIQPYSAEALWYRAWLFAVGGRIEPAIRDLEQAVSFEPNFCRGYGKLAEMSEGKDPAASAVWEEKADACRKRAAGLALEDYEMWLVEDPGA